MSTIFSELNDKSLVQLLNSGAVGILPTDTVYGLVSRAADEAAVNRLYSLKHRENKPGTVIASSIDQLIELGIKKRYLTAVNQYWHNGISIVIPTSTILNYLHQGKFSLACRIIDGPTQLVELINQTGPLLTSSANQPGEPISSNIIMAKNYFGDSVDFFVDGGEIINQKPSTIIRVVDDGVEILREGAVMIDEETGKIL